MRSIPRNAFHHVIFMFPFTGECEEIVSEPQGTFGVGKRYSFTFSDPDEYIMSVDVRAGAWVDAVRFRTNKKSSVWMGGLGGNLYQLKTPPGREILGLFGTSGTYLTSLGALLSRYDFYTPSKFNRGLRARDQRLMFKNSNVANFLNKIPSKASFPFRCF